ncbi:t-complex protein 1 [Penicillium atrosanguineum]|nr:t-complex protein 1 [Penicillium atrosanguineum]
MSLSLPGPSQAGLFKAGYQSHDAEDGAVIRNIEACQAISQTVQTSLGPYGRNKIVINHLQKMILTSDAATILRELDVVHPAAKLLVMASQQQDAEMGDGTNMVIVFAGELLKKAEELIRMGLKTSDIVSGYEKAQNFALKVLEDLEVDRLKEMRSIPELSKALRTVVASKQSGTEDTLAALVAEAVLAIMGGSLEQSRVVKGMVFGREPDGTIKQARKAKVGVFSCPIDTSQTETKGTVLLKNAQEMVDYTKGEEERLEAAVKELYDSGLRVVVAGSTVGDLAMHYLNRFNILVIKILSKFELRRLCRVVGATPLARLGAPMPDEMGQIDVVETTEIGGDRVTVFRQEEANAVTRTATIVLRGATQNHLEDVERAIDDGVNVVKAITKDPRLVPGAGATEIQLYAIRKYAEAFEVIPRTLAESAGLDATEVLSRLYTAHHRNASEESSGEEEEGSSSEEEEPYWTTGVDLEASTSAGTLDTVEEGILDLMATKSWAIRLASRSPRLQTILRLRPPILLRIATSYTARRTPISRRWESTEAAVAAPTNPKIAQIVDQISTLTLLETADLVSSLKVYPPEHPRPPRRWLRHGPRRRCPRAAAAVEEEEAAPAAAEKTLFNLKLESFEATSKPKVIKEIKNMMGLSLVDSKKFVESAPKMLKESVPKEEAEKIIETLKAIGAKVVME